MTYRALMFLTFFLSGLVVSGVASAQLFLDSQFTPSITSDIVYATGAVQSPSVGFKDLHLDLYEPSGAGVPGLKPGFVLIHGGSFTGGTKTNSAMVSLANLYSAMGYVCVSIEYRLAGDDPPTEGADAITRAVNAAIEDAANAVIWMHDNATTYGIDPTRIAIGGYSAGAITALFEGYSELGTDTEVEAVLSLSGGMYGNEALIDADDPPLIMLHGSTDTVVPFALSQDIETAAIAAPIDYEYYVLTDVGHGVPGELDTWMVNGDTLTEKIQNFMFSRLNLSMLDSDPRFILVGDSWAAQLGTNNTFESVLADEGYSNVGVMKEGVGGSTAAQWAANHNGKLNDLTTALTNNPTVDIVHINLGGNDLLAVLGSLTTQELLEAELESIIDDIEFVVDYIHLIRPSARVVLGTYDYIADVGFNNMVATMVSIGSARAASHGGYFLMNAVGWTHYYFGYPIEFSAGSVPIPGGYPDYDPVYGGDISLPGTPGQHDGGIHLVSTSYKAYIERAFDEFYRPWLLEDIGGTPVSVDFAHILTELGTPSLPMNDVMNSAILVNPGGTLSFNGASSKTTSIETGTFDKAMRWESTGGSVQIGVSP